MEKDVVEGRWRLRVHKRLRKCRRMQEPRGEEEASRPRKRNSLSANARFRRCVQTEGGGRKKVRPRFAGKVLR